MRGEPAERLFVLFLCVCLCVCGLVFFFACRCGFSQMSVQVLIVVPGVKEASEELH